MYVCQRIELLQGGEVLVDGRKLPGLPAKINEDVSVVDLPHYVVNNHMLF